MLIEGQDYHVHRVLFPNRMNYAAVVPNEDSTFDIYLNAAYEDQQAVESFLHELRHIERGDFYGIACAALCERETEGRQ